MLATALVMLPVDTRVREVDEVDDSSPDSIDVRALPAVVSDGRLIVEDVDEGEDGPVLDAEPEAGDVGDKDSSPLEMPSSSSEVSISGSGGGVGFCRFMRL